MTEKTIDFSNQKSAENCRRAGLYIHIPFCVRKCNYCAFLSFPAEGSPRREYTEALINEICIRGEYEKHIRSGNYDRSRFNGNNVNENDDNDVTESDGAITGATGSDSAITEATGSDSADSISTGSNHILTAAPDNTIKLDTIYIGGGTPSVLDVSQLSMILKAVREHFDVSPEAEITLEVNPGTLGRKDIVTRTKLTAYRSMGINRLSMGVQSMDNDRLHFMGRIHTPGDVVRDFKLAREAGFNNINLDLIFSIPRESAEEALDDAKRIIELGPEHISCYSLQMEEGTPFFDMAERGELKEVPDEEDRDTYHRLCALLRESGYEHYEISNFARWKGAAGQPAFTTNHAAGVAEQSAYTAKNAAGAAAQEKETTAYAAGAATLSEAFPAPGFTTTGTSSLSSSAVRSPFRSRHNSSYWNMTDYIGCGLGASGFLHGIRYKNTSDMQEYLSAFGKAADQNSCNTEQNNQLLPEQVLLPENDLPSEGKADSLKNRCNLPLEEEHINTPFDNISEAVFTGLRRREGITYEDALAAYGKISSAEISSSERFWQIFSDAKEEAEQFARNGFLIIDDSGIILTESGIDISNSIMSLFV